MKKDDFYGKFILREGDLRPEEINESLLKHYGFGIELLDDLNTNGLIFDNFKEAMIASTAVRQIARGVSNHTIMPEGMIAAVEDGDHEYKPRIYISGPISNTNKEKCFEAFKSAEETLIAKGYRVFSPLKNGLPFDADTHLHMRRDLNILTNEDDPFDYIYMLKRWPHSSGCKTELDNAIACGITVIFEESCDVIKFE